MAAYGGRRDIMELIAPLGPVYQAGTLSGNPLAMRAGLATLPKLEAPGFYEALDAKAQRLAEGLRAALKESGVPGQVNVAGSLLTLFFTADASARLRRREKIGHRALRRILSTTCSTAESFFRRRNSRRSSFPPPTPTRISTARSPPLAKVCEAIRHRLETSDLN